MDLSLLCSCFCVTILSFLLVINSGSSDGNEIENEIEISDEILHISQNTELADKEFPFYRSKRLPTIIKFYTKVDHKSKDAKKKKKTASNGNNKRMSKKKSRKKKKKSKQQVYPLSPTFLQMCIKFGHLCIPFYPGTDVKHFTACYETKKGKFRAWKKKKGRPRYVMYCEVKDGKLTYAFGNRTVGDFEFFNDMNRRRRGSEVVFLINGD